MNRKAFLRPSILPLRVSSTRLTQSSVHERKGSGFSARHAENDSLLVARHLRDTTRVPPHQGFPPLSLARVRVQPSPVARPRAPPAERWEPPRPARVRTPPPRA